eukprot:5796983-Karenia_brevis.AAC.1
MRAWEKEDGPRRWVGIRRDDKKSKYEGEGPHATLKPDMTPNRLDRGAEPERDVGSKRRETEWEQ